jgi:hypothetical protein
MTGIGDWYLRAAHPADRRIQFPECLFDDAGADFRGKAAAAPSFIDDDRAPGLRHRRHDGCIVERPQTTKIDDVGLDAIGGQGVCGFQRLPQRTAVGNERNVFSLTPHHRLVDGDRAGVRRELSGHVVEHDIFEDQHRVRVLERGPEHAARIFERCRGQHLEARNVRVPALETVRMLGGKLTAGAGRHADYQWNAELIARHMAHRRGGVEDLVERQETEVHRHQFDDRPHTGHRGADTGAGKSGLRKRRIANTVGTEFRQQPLAHRVTAARAADILAHQEYTVVPAKRIADRLAHRIAIG